MKKPIVIDCSAGVYEGIGLAIAANSELDIRAVTVNALFESPEKASGDVAGLCDAFGISAPVVLGATEPIIAKVRPIDDRYPRLPEGFVPHGREIKGGYAWDEIYRQAVIAEGELSVICLGPLTNLAIALFKYPELRQMLSEVVFYGGALDWGNASQTAEVNIAADPHAADAVSKSGISITMVPWSETCKAGLSLMDMPQDSNISRLFTMLEHREKFPLEQGIVLNHAAAVCYAAGFAGFSTKMHIIRVESRSRLCMGRTCPNLMYSLKKDPPNMNVVRHIEADGLSKIINSFSFA